MRFYARPGDAKSLDARRVRLAALHVPAGTPPSPFVARGPVHATLSGYLKNPLKGDYRFRLTGTGTMSLHINGKEILKEPGKEAEIELAKNYNKIEIAYAGPKTGDSTVRLDWAGEKFGFEPLPPDSLFSRKDDADLAAQTELPRRPAAVRRAALCELPLFAGQARAQGLPDAGTASEGGRGWTAAGNRFNRDWLVAWILDPRIAAAGSDDAERAVGLRGRRQGGRYRGLS